MKCIDTDTLTKYFEGWLSDKDTADMFEHIIECPDCSEAFAGANAIMRDKELDEWEPVSEQTAQNILKDLSKRIPFYKRLWRFLIDLSKQIKEFFETLPLQRQPAFVRSNKKISSEQEIFLCGKEISFDKDENSIKVTIKEHTENMTVTLKKDNGKVFARIPTGNSVKFENLPDGSYNLIFEDDRKKSECFFQISRGEIHELDNLS